MVVSGILLHYLKVTSILAVALKVPILGLTLSHFRLAKLLSTTLPLIMPNCVGVFMESGRRRIGAREQDAKTAIVGWQNGVGVLSRLLGTEAGH